MSGASPSHLGALTGIRGIAAWGVVLYHIRLSLTGLLPPSAIAFLAKGYLAVDLFFILSGFVIWFNYAQRLSAGGWSQVGPFLWRRFARVWPLHGAILSAFVAFALLLAFTGRDHSGYPWAELPLHVLLVQNWGFTPDLSWNHPAWSISAELAAYLLFPALVFAARWDRVPTGALVSLAVLTAAGLHTLFALSGHERLGDAISAIGLWRCLGSFAIGCLLCQLWQRWQDMPPAGPIGTGLCIAIVAAGLAFALPETMWIPGAFASGLLALALDRNAASRFFGGRGLTYLGEISYSTYLSHFFLFILFKLAFVDASLQLGWGALAGFLALVLAVSAGLYHGLEKPAQRWLNSRYPQRTWRPANAPAE